MKAKILIIPLIALLLVGSAMACISILNPAERLPYWKLHTYSLYNDMNNYPTLEGSWSIANKETKYLNDFGSGLIYNLMVDVTCPDMHMLTHRGMTGGSSPFFTLTEKDGNVLADPIVTKLYSYSIYNYPLDMSGSQSQLNCLIEGINYCQLPDSFQPANFQKKHYWLYNDWNAVCDKSLTIEQQLLKIKKKIWDNCALVSTSPACGNFESHVDCVWANSNGKCAGTTNDYASLFAVMARRCGIPTRYVDGYGEMVSTQDGKYVFNGGVRHAWVEVFWPNTKAWGEYEVTEDNQGFLNIETQCLDGLDNDGDQQIDCADGDCARFTECTNPLPEPAPEPVAVAADPAAQEGPQDGQGLNAPSAPAPAADGNSWYQKAKTFWTNLNTKGKAAVIIIPLAIVGIIWWRRRRNVLPGR